MHFDDRLATVLRVRAGGANAARTQYRQMVDLLGTVPSDARSEVIDSAFIRLSDLSAAIPAADRAAVLSEPGLRLRSPRLLAQLAVAEPSVAIAAMKAARLGDAEWLDLIPTLPIAVRGHVRQRRDLGPEVEAQLAQLGIGERALPPIAASNDDKVSTPLPVIAPVSVPRAAATSPQPVADLAERICNHPQEIGAIVERIETFRRQRAAAHAAAPVAVKADSAALNPLSGLPLTNFDFTCDENGRIGWADGPAAPMIAGLRIASRDETSPVQSTSALIEAFRRRLPIRGSRVSVLGAPSIAGDWLIDAAPGFDSFGRFTGYRGRFQRPSTIEYAQPSPAADSEADRIRQLLHELRTPVNAIQGFAEVIQQQLFGPTPHEYRAHAAAIAGDAARMLAGFDELERLARLDSGVLALDLGATDLAAIVGSIVQQLEAHTARRSSGFDLECDEPVAPVALSHAEAERLVWRLLATLAGAAAPGERLRLRIRHKQNLIRLSAALPASLAAQADIFRAEPPANPGPLSAGMFGAGFALRLASAEAQAAGGKLEQRADKLRLELPLSTGFCHDSALLNTENKGNVA